jgi:hypothetical protein
MPYNTSFAFDSVVVLESLPPGDLRTGRDLFETTLAPASVADPGFVSEFYEPQSGADFLAALATIGQTAKRYGRSPIVHIETHGGTEGIALCNSDLVRWADVADRLTAINRVSRMNLLVVAAMCHGWYMSEILRPTDAAPAFGIVGALDGVSAGELLQAMKRLYASLTSSNHDFRLAMDAANQGKSVSDWTYRMEGAELMLCKVYRRYVADLAIGETRTQRINPLVADAARLRSLDVLQTAQFREEVSPTLDDHEKWFMMYRKRFLMLEEFPENEPRFPLRFHDCGQAAA